MDIKGIPKLTILTFAAWEKAITLALMAEGCMNIVEGIEEQPDPPRPLGMDPTPEQISRFESAEATYRRENLSYSTRTGKAAWMISQTLGEGVDSHIKDTNDPFTMWTVLRDAMDTRSNKIHQREIRAQFSDLRHDGKGTIDEYIAKLKGYQHAMVGTTDSISDDALVNKIMTTLPKEWSVKLRAIEDDQDLQLPKLERVLRNFQAVLTREKVGDIALATKGKGFKGKKRWEGGKSAGKTVDKKVADGRVTKSKDKDKAIECWHCL